MPRLAGFDTAIEMITGVRPIKAEKALAAGIVDRVEEGDGFSNANTERSGL